MGARLRVLRAVRGYTQAQLSALTGLSPQYLSGLEQGKRPRPRVETLESLAAALGVSVEELKGTVPLRDVFDPADPPGEPEAGVEAVVRGAFALTGTVPEGLATIHEVGDLLAAIPPGVVVMHRTYPDGSVVLYIRLPPGTARPPG